MKEIVIKGLNEKVYEHTTPEGLKVYLWQNEKVKSTYMSLSVNYGSIHTHFKVGNKTYKVPNGVAHFLEHVKFNMDKDTTAHDIFTRLGGEANAFTTFKYTSYIVYTSQKVKENLDTLLDFVYTPYFTKPLINKEKGIIVEEAKMGIDDPYSVSYYEFLKQLFHKCRFRNEITGNPNEINAITLEDIENVYNFFYHPENMFLIVTGNINPYEIVKWTEDNLSGKKFGKFVNPKVIGDKEDKSVVKKHQSLKLNVTTPEYRYAIKIPRKNFKNITDQELFIYLYILGQINFGPSSDFRENLRSKELVYSFNCRINFIEDYIIVTFYAITDYYKEVEKCIKEQLENYILTKEEFSRKKKAEIASLILKYDDVIAVNELIQNNIITDGKVIDNTKEIFENLNIETMQEIIANISFDNVATMIVENKKD